MTRVERHIIVKDKNIDHLCFLSKNLYNYCNYLIHQEFYDTGNMPSEYEMTAMLAKTDQVDYRALPTQTSQQIVKLLYKNWWSFFKANKVWKKNPASFMGKPKIPQFKHKIKGRNIVIFTGQQIRLKDGYIYFPELVHMNAVKTKVNHINQVRIVPQANCYIVEVGYEKEVEQHELDENLHLSVDLGINNLATLTTDSGDIPLLVNGRIIKSMNQYYNKKRAVLKSYVNGKSSNRLNTLDLKRNNKVTDYMHKASRFIINYCITNKIGNIVIGYNKGWKDAINIGRVNNQKFVSIPHFKLIQQIQYKAEDVGIHVCLHEESYTSKCDALALEPVEKREIYTGKRKKRGLFQSSTGKTINADVNGSINILRKVIGDSFVKTIADIGLAERPIRVHPYEYDLAKCTCFAN